MRFLKWLFKVNHRSDFDDFTRVNLLRLCGFRIALHIFKKDDHHCAHDHPYNIWSFMLWGGYEEMVETHDMRGFHVRRRRILSLARIPAQRMHKVKLLGGRRAVTLCFFGRRHRRWGFRVKRKWVDNAEYFKKYGSKGAC